MLDWLVEHVGFLLVVIGGWWQFGKWVNKLVLSVEGIQVLVDKLTKQNELFTKSITDLEARDKILENDLSRIAKSVERLEVKVDTIFITFKERV